MIFLFFTAILTPLSAQTIPTDFTDVVSQVERINSMREQLAATIPPQQTPTLDSFKAVCMPVGAELKALAANRKWSIRQAAEKYRNPEHKAQTLEVEAISKFKKNPNLLSYFTTGQLQQQSGVFYFRRINVQKSCLKCHGQKSQRPKFIVEKYKKDKAFDFKEGDLRAIYRIFVPHK
ncbi:MAG: DUF3365 domain-containing protein [Bdellovibrionales bacterium]|nr:DUF3365 domain-containing protein [Bdellovibrionales bacterium]